MDQPDPPPPLPSDPAAPEGARPGKRRRRLPLRLKVTFAVVSALLPLALLEGGLRLAGLPSNRVRTVSKLINVDPETFERTIGLLVPSTTSTVAWPPELSYTVRVNALGLRGPDVALERTPGVPRVLMLGDSFTFGYYVEEDETVPALLQAWLRERGVPGTEVVNGALGGWSIDSATEFLEERAIQLSPDVVVLGFCCNDVADLDRERSVFQAAKAELGEQGGQLKKALYATAIYEVVLRFKVALKRWRQEASGEAHRPLASVDLSPERLEACWTSYGEWLKRLQGFLAARDIPLVVLFHPDPMRLETGQWGAEEERLAGLCAAVGVPFVSAHAAVEGRRADEVFHLPLDGHPNAAGNRVTAEVLGRFLLEQRERLGLAAPR